MSLYGKILKENTLSFTELYYLRDEFALSVSAERKILENSESFNQQLRKGLNEDVDKNSDLKGDTEDYDDFVYHQQLFEHLFGRQIEIIEKVFENQRKSSVLSIYSIVESHLKKLCNSIQKEFNFEKGVENMQAHSDLAKVKTYLNEIYGLKISSASGPYSVFVNQKYIRNRIAHNSSSIESNYFGLIKSTIGLDYLNDGTTHELVITNNLYHSYLLTEAEKLSKILICAIDQRYKTLKAQIGRH